MNTIGASARLGSTAGQGTLTTSGTITIRLDINSAVVNMNLTDVRLGRDSRMTATAFNGTVSVTDFGGTGGSANCLHVVRNTFNRAADFTSSTTATNNFPGFSGNVFNGDTQIRLSNNATDVYLCVVGNGINGTAPYEDIFNANLTLHSTTTRSITSLEALMQVKGNLTVNCAAQGSAYFTRMSVTGTSTFNLTGVTGGPGIEIAQEAGQPATFGGNVSINSSNSTLDDLFRCARLGTAAFNGNITVQNTGGASGLRRILIGDDTDPTGSVTLAAGKTIGLGASGMPVGELRLAKITQAGTSNTHTHTLPLTGTALLTLQGSTLYGTVTATAPTLQVRRSTFHGPATLQQTSTVAGTFVECGGNTFKSSAELNLSGTGLWLWGRALSGDGGPDVFEGAATLRASETTTPMPPKLLLLNTGRPTGLTTGTPAAGAFNTTQRDAAYANFTAARTAALATQAAALEARNEASYMNSFVPSHNTVVTAANATLTAANTNATAANSANTTYPNAASVNDLTKLNDLISRTNALNSNTNARNTSINAHNTATNAVNSTERNTRNDTGLLSLADNTAGNEFRGATQLITQNRGRIFVATEAVATVVFGSTLSLTNTGTGGNNGAIAVANNGTATFNGAVSSTNNFANATPGDYQPLILFGAQGYGTPTGRCTFNENITLTSNGSNSGCTQFGSGAAGVNATQTLASGKTLTLSNFNFGDLIFYNFTQTGTGTPHSFTVQPGVRLIIGRRTTFNSAVTIENRSTSPVWPAGVVIGNSSNDVDITFNNDLLLRNTAAASNNIVATYTGGSTLFLNGNVVVESTGTDRDILFGEPWDGATTGTPTLASGKTITVGPAGFSGMLGLLNFKQLGTTPQSIQMANGICPGTRSMILVDRNCEWYGDVAFAAANFTLRRSTYYGTVNMINWCQNVGASGGGNLFKKTAGFTFRGPSPHFWAFGSGAPIGGDTFEADVAFNNENTGSILVAHEGSTVFQMPVTLRNNEVVVPGGGNTGRVLVANVANPGAALNATFRNSVAVRNASVNSTSGFLFSERGRTEFQGEVQLHSSATGAIEFTPDPTGGATVLKSGARFTAGTYTAGNLTLGHVTQEGAATPQVLAGLATPATDLIVKIGPNTTWNSPFSCTAPRIMLNGATYNGTTLLECNWTPATAFTPTASAGGNTFNGPATLRNSSSNNHRWIMASTTGDDFNNDATFDVNHAAGGEFRFPANTTTFAGNLHIKSIRDEHFAFGNFWDAGCTAGTVRFDGTGVQAVTADFSSTGTATGKALFFRNIEMSQQTPLSSVTLGRHAEIRNATFTMGRLVAGASTINLGATSACGSLANQPFAAAATPTGFGTPGGNANSYIVVNGSGYVRSQVTAGSLPAAFPVGNALHYLPLAVAQAGGAATDVFRIQVKDGVNTAYDAGNTPTGASVQQYFANGVWAVSEENTTTGSNNLTLAPGWLADAELADFDRSRTLVAKYNKTTNRWRCLQPAAAAGTVAGLFTQPAAGLSGTLSGSPAATGFTSGDLYAVASTSAAAGPDRNICVVANTNSFSLNANPLNPPFAGRWTRTAGPGTVSLANATDANTAVSISAAGTHTFRWSNEGLEGGCGGTNFDDVTVTVGSIGTPPAATSVTWTGAVNRDWFECGNWSPNKIPDVDTDALLADVTNDPLITVAGAECRNLTIPAGAVLELGDAASLEVAGNWSRIGTGTVTNNAGTVIFSGGNTTLSGATALGTVRMEKNTSAALTLQSELVVNNRLVLTRGLVQTAALTQLVVADNATSTSGSALSYVQGPMRKRGDEAFAFPVGKGGRWARIAITDLAGATAGTEFQAEYFLGNPNGSHDPNSPVLSGTGLYDASTVEYWQLDRTATTANARVTLYWENAPASGINQFSTDLRVIRFNGSKWEDKGSILGGTLAAGNVSSSAVQTDFSPWTFGSLTPNPVNPLPVRLLSFKAAAAGPEALLHWTTTDERDASHFEVERSTDRRTFVPVGRVEARNQGQRLNTYRHADANPAPGVNYYRLKMVDADGSTDYSRVEAVRMDGGTDMRVHPNPTRDALLVEMGGTETGRRAWAVCDLTGRQLLSGAFEAAPGRAETLSLAGLPAGTYLLRITANGTARHVRVVKQ